MKRSRILIPVILAVGACTPPDVSTGLGAAKTLLDQSTEKYEIQFAKDAERERLKAESVAIQNGQEVVKLEGECSALNRQVTNTLGSPCTLVSKIEQPKEGLTYSWFFEGLSVIGGYFDALIALADSKTSDQVSANADQLLSALSTQGADQVALFGRIGDLASRQKEVASAVVALSVKQYRITKLKEVMIAGDPIVSEFAEKSAEFLLIEDSDLSDKQAALAKAEEELEEALEREDPAAYRIALKKLRAAFSAYKKAEAESSALPILTVAKMHSDLLGRLQSKASPADVSKTLSEISALLDILRKES